MKVIDHDPTTYTLIVNRGEWVQLPALARTITRPSAPFGTRDLVRFGIFTFSSDDNPAAKIVDLNDFGKKDSSGYYLTTSTQTINDNILDRVAAIRGRNATPLARALAYVWNYLKPNPGTGTADYIVPTNMKAVDSSTFGTSEKFETMSGVTRPKGSPMEYWCQENYVVMITNGISPTDESGFTYYPVFNQASQKTSVAGSVISDFFKFDYNRSYGPTPWGDTVYDGYEYLTDVAYFAYHQDMFPTRKIKTGVWDTTNKLYTSGTPEADATLYDEANTDPPNSGRATRTSRPTPWVCASPTPSCRKPPRTAAASVLPPRITAI